jgi:hypothetical protein
MTIETEKILGMTSSTIAGDLLGALVQELRLLPDIWAKLPKHEQDDIIERLRKRVADNVRQAVTLIASEERITVAADLQKVTFGKEVQAVFTIGSRDPGRLELALSRGKACLIVVTDPGLHLGGMDSVTGDPDQPSFDGIDPTTNSIIEQTKRRSKSKGKDENR